MFCGALPAVALIVFYDTMTGDGTLAFDFRPFYRAAGAILEGETPYPAADDPLTAWTGPYVYPPFGALISIPFRAVPFDVAGVVVMVLLTAAALAIPYLLGVRDWRCFGVVFLWPPVWNAIQTGNMTLVPRSRGRDRLAIPGRAIRELGGGRRDARREVLPVAARRLVRGHAEGSGRP